jgi:hypothetical protein
MSSSRMLGRVALVRIEVSEGPSTSIIRVIRIGERGTTLSLAALTPGRDHGIHLIGRGGSPQLDWMICHYRNFNSAAHLRVI